MHGLLIFYLTFYFREKPLAAAGTGWTAFRLVTTNALVYAAFVAASIVICVCATTVFQLIARIMSMSFVAVTNSMFEEVARETGPGLSRSVPYSISLMVRLILSLAVAVYCMLILPFRLASDVLDRLLRRASGKVLVVLGCDANFERSAGAAPRRAFTCVDPSGVVPLRISTNGQPLPLPLNGDDLSTASLASRSPLIFFSPFASSSSSSCHHWILQSRARYDQR